MPEDFLSSWRSRYQTPDPTPPAGGSGDFLSSWRNRYQAPDDDEEEFQSWYAERAKRLGLDLDPDAPEQKYDYRAARRAGAEPGPDGHWPSEFKADDHPNRFVQEGIFTLDSKTGKRTLTPKPGALPTAEIDTVHPNLPDGRPLDIGAAGRLAARTAADTIPGLARLGTSVSEFMYPGERPEPTTLGGALKEGLRDSLRWNPVTAGLPLAAKAWEKLGIAGLSNENERKMGEESDRILGSGDDPTTAALADYGARILGNFADVTNLIPAKPAQAALKELAKRGDRAAIEELAKTAAREIPPTAAAPAPAAATSAAERRLADMSREELLEIATTSDVTGLRNKRAWIDVQGSAGIKNIPESAGSAPKPIVVASDVDSLKWVNDTFGHQVGDELLRRKGQAFKDLNIEGYHLSGDEFAARFDTEEEAGAKMDELRAYLADRSLDIVGKDGQRFEVRVDFSHGLGSDLKAADEALGLSKVARTAERRRAARGEAPPEVDALGVPADVPGRRGLQVPGLQGTAEEALAAVPDSSPEILGREGVAFLADNTPVRFRYVLRDADSVITSHKRGFAPDERFPHKSGAQPRDLNDTTERLKIEGIKQTYNPLRVGPSTSVSGDGAAFIARQTEGQPFTIIGNSRTHAQREALEDPLNLASQLEALKAQGPEAGLPDGFLEEVPRLGMRKPSLFRELLGDFDVEALGRDGNVGSTGRLSDLAVAKSDAARMSPDLLSIVDGELPLDSASNREFVRGFLGEVVPQVEHASMVGRAGELTVVGQRRIRNALLSAAFQDSDTVGKMVESDGEGIRNVGRGMLAAAARLAKQAQLARVGARYPRDIGPDVAQAAGKLADLRAKGQPVEMYLKNGELYGQELTDEGRFLLEQFDLLKRDQSAVGGVLRRYSELVESYGDPNQMSLMGPGEAPSKLEILKEAVATWKQAEQPLLFPGGSAGVISSFADSLPGPLSIIANPAKVKELAAAGKKLVTRRLTNFGDVAALGDLAPEFAEKARLSVAQRTAEEGRASTNLRDFGDALERMMKSLREAGIARTEDDVIGEALDGVMGKSAMDGLSPALRSAVGAMRTHLDELTGGLLQDAMLSKDLRLKLENNLGEYLRRTYEIHRDPLAWEKVVKTDEPWRWENAKRWASEQYPEMDEGQVEGFLNKMLQKQGEAVLELAPRSDAFRIDKGIFKHRQQQHLVHMEGGPTRSYPTKEAAEKAAATSRDAGRKVTVDSVDGLPQPLEQFLGLHMDPRARYSESVAKMAHDIATSKLMRDLRVQGEGTIFHQQATGEFASRLGGDPAFDALAGLFTTPEIKTTLEAIGRGTAKGPPWLQKLAVVNALVRTGKTVGSPQTHVRNLLSWIPMLVANGHFSSVVNIPAFYRAGKTLFGGSRLTLEGRTHRMLESLADSMETVSGKKLGDVFRWDIPALRADHQMATRLGIIKEGARSEEMARYLGILADTKVGKKLADNAKGAEKLAKSVADSNGMMRALYGAEDDLGKMVAWRMERANYQWAFPDKTADEIAELTAPMVRDLYPTYSKAVPAVRAVRDFPFVGDFPTFWAEIGRTTKNVAKQGIAEIRSTNPRLKMVGAKRLAGLGTAIVAPVAVAATFSGRTGVSEKERQAVSQFVPDWNRYSDLIPVEKKGPGRYSLIDASYVNPYANGREAWNALMASGLDWNDQVEASFREAFGAFMNEGIVVGTGMDIARNRTDDGRQVYPEHGTDKEKLWAMAEHAWGRFQPGAVSLGQDVRAGISGAENPRTGRPVDLAKLAYSFFSGVRPIEVDVPKQLSHQAFAMQGARRDIVGRWNRVKNRKGSSPSALLDAKRSANDAWRRKLIEMQFRVDAARETGLSDFQIRRVFKGDPELSDETVNALLNGSYFEVAR